MQLAYEVVSWAQLGIWTVLGLAALNVWWGRRDEASRWLVATFVPLGLIVALGRFLPDDSAQDMPVWLMKVFIAILALFPYCLYGFVNSFVRAARWERIVVRGLTAVVLAVTAVAPRFPGPDDPRPGWVTAYTALFGLLWGIVLTRVAWRLWTARRGQAAIVRRRLAAMGSGAAGLAAVLVFGIFSPSNGDPTILHIIVQSISLCLGPFFLLGFAPPSPVRTLWRRREDAAVRDMEIALAGSLSHSDVAASFLPPIVAVLGGQGAALLDADRELVAAHGLSHANVEALRSGLPTESELYEPVASGNALRLRMENGWLVVTVGPFTPFFGTEELQMLSASAVVADLALGRATLFELERKSREAMQDFVAIASHDLRTPVTVIHGFSRLMTEGWDTVSDDDKRGFVGAIDRQVVHLDRLISDLLTVSKLDVGEMGVFAETVDLSSLVATMLDEAVTERSIDYRAEPSLLVLADPEHVARMVQNCVSNAITYGAPPVAVEISRDGGYATLRVRDHGNGVPEHFVPRLFEKFARADKKRSKAASGTGLGLSIVRGLARANGGEAWYEPNMPTGACFAIRLPLALSGTNGQSGR